MTRPIASREWTRDAYTISTDPARLDLDVIHGYLSRSYWATGIPRAIVERSVEHSMPFGVYLGDTQVGFARLVTDYATFAYLADVFILEEQRGRGLSKWLVEVIVRHPELQGLRRWMLATKDAHGLYAKFGFVPLAGPDRWMERAFPNLYRAMAPEPGVRPSSRA